MIPPDPTNPEHVALARAHPLGWAWMCSGGTYLRPKHVVYKHQVIAEILSSDTGGRLLIEEPPGHSKSWTLRYVVGWFMGMNRGKDVMFATHSKSLADRFGNFVRADLDGFGEAVFGQSLRKDTRAKGDWALTGGGEFFGVGAGGSPHGRRSALLVTDDLMPNAEASRSDVQMSAIDDFLRSDLISRRAMGWYAHIGIQTRWSPDDPHGILMKVYPGLYDVIRFPAIATGPDVLGRVEGEALWPEGYPIEVLEEIRLGMHPHRWAALYQQDPVAASGGIWQRKWWDDQTYTLSEDRQYVVMRDGERFLLSDMRRFVVVDLAISEKKTADYTVIGAFAMTTERLPRLIILDMRRERMQGPDINPAVRKMLGDWNASVAYYEKAGQQTMVAQYARRESVPALLIGRDKDCDVQIAGDKVAVAYEATPFAAAGRLIVPLSAGWLADWESELLAFPSLHDDMADVTAWACHIVMKMGRASLIDAYRPPVEPGALDVRSTPPSERHRDEDRDRNPRRHVSAWGGPRPRAW